MQEAFLKAFDALPRFREGAPLRPWLLRIVANEARNRRRSAGRRQGLARRAAEAVPPAARMRPAARTVMAEILLRMRCAFRRWFVTFTCSDRQSKRMYRGCA